MVWEFCSWDHGSQILLFFHGVSRNCKVTTVHFYDEVTGKVTYACSLEGVYHSPLPQSVCLLFDSHCHYDVLLPRSKCFIPSSTKIMCLLAGDLVELMMTQDIIADGTTVAVGAMKSINTNNSQQPIVFEDIVYLPHLLVEYNSDNP